MNDCEINLHDYEASQTQMIALLYKRHVKVLPSIKMKSQNIK